MKITSPSGYMRSPKDNWEAQKTVQEEWRETKTHFSFSFSFHIKEIQNHTSFPFTSTFPKQSINHAFHTVRRRRRLLRRWFHAFSGNSISRLFLLLLKGPFLSFTSLFVLISLFFCAFSFRLFDSLVNLT